MKKNLFLLLFLSGCSWLNDPAPVIPAEDAGVPATCQEAYQDPTKYLPVADKQSYQLFEQIHDCACSISCPNKQSELQEACDTDAVSSLVLDGCSQVLSVFI
jgi:hypothetical protein